MVGNNMEVPACTDGGVGFLDKRGWGKELSVDEEDAVDSGGCPGEAVGPSADAAFVLPVHEDAAVADACALARGESATDPGHTAPSGQVDEDNAVRLCFDSAVERLDVHGPQHMHEDSRG